MIRVCTYTCTQHASFYLPRYTSLTGYGPQEISWKGEEDLEGVLRPRWLCRLFYTEYILEGGSVGHKRGDGEKEGEGWGPDLCFHRPQMSYSPCASGREMDRCSVRFGV